MKYWVTGMAIGLLVVLGAQMTGYGQGAADDLAARLRDRYDVVALQQGVAFVPRETGRGMRMIQVVDGVVTVDGETLTGAQLRARLGSDADLILQVSYLTLQQQRELGGIRQGGDQASAPPAVDRSRVTRGDRLRFGEPVRVEADERVDGDVFSFGGPITVEGEITGDVSSFGGPVRLGPRAIVRGDINVMGGGLDRDAGAQVLGEVNDMGGRRGPFRRGWIFPHLFGSLQSRLSSLVATATRISLLVLLGIVAVAFGRGAVDRVAARTAVSPLRAGLVGLLAEILFLPVLILTCIVLAVSIIGIPLLVLIPFLVLLLGIVMLIGFVGLASQMGRRITDRFGWTGRGPYATVAIGVVTIGAITLIGKLAGIAGGFFFGAPLSAVGYLVEYVAWTMGFGASILVWYETQPRFGPGRHAGTTAHSEA